MGTTKKPTFEEVVREYTSFIRKMLSGCGVDARALPDVAQEVLRGVSRSLRTFDPFRARNMATTLRAWLLSICRRKAANYHHAEWRRNETLCANEALAATLSNVLTAEEALLEKERKALFDYLTASLDPCQRAVLIAYEIEGVPMQQVAAEQSIPLGTAYNRLRLARISLIVAAKRWRAGERGNIARKSRQ